eukprot:c9493_g1_i1.p1 GENE.c9493_g1_i1~~c9493_g1_i1.p1  ORF type:complete len:1229 (+),score=405.94 c9493_g1_i1:73-3759(+)
MYLYSLTIQRPQSITQAAYGNFSSSSAHELVVARSARVLELLRVDTNSKLQTVISTDVFGVIRSIAPFRLAGATTDYIIVSSDSGKITILEVADSQFKKVHLETFGKSGCRRIVAGEYVAVDPSGRACMVAAIEKQKFVYVLNRDAGARLTISSPLEGHRNSTFVFHCVGVDVGYDNPIFATIEVEYEDDDDDKAGDDNKDDDEAVAAEKVLVYYELDLALNHVVRKWSDPIGFNANMLVAVPGGSEGPGGVLVCCENLIVYKHQGCDDRLALLPRRKGMPDDQPLLVVSSLVVRRKTHTTSVPSFFFLLQSELGDLYETTLDIFDGEVRDIRINYFDTVPVCTSLCFLKNGLLFAAAEFGNHILYKFLATSADVHSKGTEVLELESGAKLVRFTPGPVKRLAMVDKLESASPMLDLQVEDLCHEDAKQVYTFCGRGYNSSLRIMRHGLPVSEIAASQLPSIPNGVWTIKRRVTDTHDAFIVVSFSQATIVLSVEERAVQEVTDSGFVNNVSTIAVSLLGDDAIVQIHPDGMRHIGANNRKQDWKPPGKSTIVKAAVNHQQVVIAMSGGMIQYFELDEASHLLEVDKKDMGYEITSIDIPPVSEGRTRANFLTVATSDSAVRILSLQPNSCLSVLAVQRLPDIASSLCLISVDDGQSGSGESSAGQTTQYLNIGLNNGVVLRTVMDPIKGSLTDTRTRYLGSRPVKLFRISLRGAPAVLALSSRPWLCYAFQRRFHMTPLSYQQLEHASPFASQQCLDGMVAISQNFLRIFMVEKLGDSFNQLVVPLSHTPRKSLVHPDYKTLLVLESDHRALPSAQLKEQEDALKQEENGDVMATDGVKAENGDDDDDDEENNVVALPAPAGTWGSCIRMLDPTQLTQDDNLTHVLSLIELPSNEAALCMCLCPFLARSNEIFLVVGTAVDYQLLPRSCSKGLLRAFRFEEGGKKLVQEHETELTDSPMAVCAFQGRLLVGVGNVLRIYDMGKRKLLRKCENKSFPNTIVRIHTEHSRIVVGDMCESFFFCKYRKDTNSLHVFADDTFPRWLSASCQLDLDTVAGADKFGNFFITSLPAEISEVVDDDPTGARINWFSHGYLNGAPNKLETLVNFYTGDVITSMRKAILVAGGDEVILCSTVSGAIIAFLPVTSKSEVDFLTNLEMHLRQEHPPISGRDHIAFRSSYFPVKSVVDGDLCEMFTSLPYAKQRAIAEELDNRTPAEVAKKLEVMRNHVL